MHECPECGQACGCDNDDVFHEPSSIEASLCACACGDDEDDLDEDDQWICAICSGTVDECTCDDDYADEVD